MSGAQNHSRAVTRPFCNPLRAFLQRQPLLPLAISAASGITIDSLLASWGGSDGSPLRAGIWIGATLVASLLILWRPSRVSAVAMVIVFFPVAACSHCLHDLRYGDADLLTLVGTIEQPAVLEGVIDLPVVLRRHPLAEWRDERGDSPWQTQFEMHLDRMRLGRRMQPCRGRALVIVDGDCSHRRPGDVVRVLGDIGAFKAPTNPGEPDRRATYRQRGLHARVECDGTHQVNALARRPTCRHYGFSFIATLAARSRELLLKHMDESTGSLAAALVLGQRDFVDEATRDLLLVTGTAHLLSVSGLHLAIVVAIAGWFATVARLPLSARILWIVAVCTLYTGITGARPPVVRASILVGTLMLALWMRRPGQPVNTLSLAAMILMAVNPQLLFNMGVQLSFLAVTTLLTCGRQRLARSQSAESAIEHEERLRLLVDRSRSRSSQLLRAGSRQSAQALWFSTCVTAISMPLVWQSFHVVSPVSIATNVVLGPIMFVALASGVLTVVMGFIFEPGMFVPATICEWTMDAMLSVIRFAASVPGGHHWLPAPPGWWVVVFYVLIVASMWFGPGRRVALLRYGWIGVWLATAYSMATSPAPLSRGSIEATFVDVGHGTCVVIRFSDDDVWMYDCGRLGNDSNSSRGIDSVLWSLGVTNLQGVFISHADADHFNALPGVLRRFRVNAIYTPPKLFEDPAPALSSVRDALQKHALEPIELQSGSIVIGECGSMSVLHPPVVRVAGSDNANSLVLRIDCGGTTLVLPGDLEPPGTEVLIRRDRPFPGGVLMAPHHGSLRMDAAAVLQWARPGITIVSGGQRADRPEVHQMLAETGSHVYVTSHGGAIRVRIDSSGQIDVDNWKQKPW